MKKRYLLILVMMFCFSCNSQNATDKLFAVKNQNSKTIKLINGNWFNGEKFEKKTVWIKEGLLKFKPVEKIDTIINLSNRYVIPPFAEAHNHNLESAYGLDKRIASYLNNGVFYVKLLSSIKKRIEPLMHNYNKPEGIDVSLAHAPLTASGGHPITLRKSYLNKGYFRGLFNSIEEIEFHGYVIIDNKEDLENKWDSIMSFKPDFIKINLLHSEEYEKRKNDSSYFGQKGLNPKLVPLIVNQAHSEGLRVSAHVETAYDFHIAVDAGVDEIAHLPEIKNGKPIEKNDIALAKEKETVIVTTVSLVTKKQNSSNYDSLLNNIKSNLQLFKDVGTTIAIGSDMYNDNSSGEFQILQQLNVFSNLELLKMWTENSTKTIFPNRMIGKLKDGYEASFLVLDKNPIADITDINKNINIRVKQGIILK